MSIIGRVKIFTCKINITHAWYFKPIIGYDMSKNFFDESINFINIQTIVHRALMGTAPDGGTLCKHKKYKHKSVTSTQANKLSLPIL